MRMNIQKQIVNYWEKANHRYDDLVQRELESEMKKTWRELLEENCPPGETLKILDIGTGPGFFSLLLSEMGHKVTAIDCTQSMLDTARKNAEMAGFDVEFHLMDAHELDFEDHSFDMIINRNVTWLLNEPEDAYQEWHRVLKPGGRLLIFDGNHYLWMFDDDWKRDVEEVRQKSKRGGYKIDQATREECDRIAKELFFSKIRRPQWDVPVLLNLGFGEIFVDADVSGKINEEKSSKTNPLFLIRAQKMTGDYLYGSRPNEELGEYGSQTF